ncbi:MAG: hypothetical protein QMC67_17590 [Candidatus Wallbacteria bacterium]
MNNSSYYDLKIPVLSVLLFQRLKFIVVFVIFVYVFFNFAPKVFAAPDPLTLGMQLMNQKKFSEARQVLKNAIQSDPYNELLWTAFESCVRSDAYNSIGNAKEDNEPAAKKQAAEKTQLPENSAKFDIDENDTVAVMFKNLQAASELNGNRTDAPNVQDQQSARDNIDGQENFTLESDFSGGTVKGALGCILTESFKFVKVDNVSFLALKSGIVTASMTFSFQIKKTFPRKIMLGLSHRVLKRDKYKTSAKFTLNVNDNKINYDDIKLGNTVENIEFDVTNFCKNGGNIINITVDKSAAPYLLKSVKLTQLNKL